MVFMFETHLKPGLSVLETVVGVGSTFYMLVTMVKVGVWSLFETHLKPGLSVLETVVGVGSTFYMLVTRVKVGVWSLCLRLT